MVRQYIGARYVPKFTGEYDATLAYEPLSIVQVGNNFYTSKIPVPPGTPVTNAEYWALTGNYNGAIADLQNSIDEVAGQVEQIGGRYPRRTYYRPEDYGAVVNDPSIDCSSAIRQCIDLAMANGGIILLSEGTYYCATPIQVAEKPYCLNWYGAGNSVHGSAPGTIIKYTGEGTFLSFNSGYWEGVFENLSFACAGGNSTCLKFNDSAVQGSRTHKVKFENCGFYFRTVGLQLKNPSYVILDNCTFRGDPSYQDANRRGLILGGDADPTRNTVEYVSLINCRFSMQSLSTSQVSLNSCGIYMDGGTHVTIYHTDITDCDTGIYLDAYYQIGFFDTYSCDFARTHVGIRATLRTTSILESNHFAPTFTGTGDNNDRILKVDKVAGGAAYAARIKYHDYTIRTGLPDVWIEADLGCLYPAACSFTNSSGFDDPAKIVLNQPQRATLGTCGVGSADRITADFNDYTMSGFIPYNFRNDSTNGPGFDCLLVVMACNAYVVQVAIGTGSQPIAKRALNRTNGIWTAWQSYTVSA